MQRQVELMGRRARNRFVRRWLAMPLLEASRFLEQQHWDRPPTNRRLLSRAPSRLLLVSPNFRRATDTAIDLTLQSPTNKAGTASTTAAPSPSSDSSVELLAATTTQASAAAVAETTVLLHQQSLSPSRATMTTQARLSLPTAVADPAGTVPSRSAVATEEEEEDSCATASPLRTLTCLDAIFLPLLSELLRLR